MWKELNAALGRKANRGKIQLDTGSVIIQSPKQIASQLNSHFAPPSTSPALDLGQPPVHHTNTVFQFQPIEEEEVLLALERLNTCKATRSDGVSAYLLRTVAAVISPSITKFFNDCIVSGQTPAEWKEANVTPVPKSSSARFPSDFRPVSVIPVIAKVYESLIYKQLYTYLTTNSLLQPNQSGFRPFHSTQDALLRTMDDWRIALDLGKSVGAVFLDLSKAFDSIDHSLLLRNCSPMELKEMSTGGNYLDGRKQRVKLKGCYSDWANVLRGVPQGSILGPLLFLLYVNNLPDVVTKCTVNMYADDVAIYLASKDVNEVADSLNEDLSHIATWIDMNRLKINIGKTQLMTVGGQSFKSKWQQFDVQLHGTLSLRETQSDT